MIIDRDYLLKKTFRETFPEYALRLDEANSENLMDTYHQILDECRQNLSTCLGEKANELLGDDSQAMMALALMPERANSICQAKGDEIKYELQEILNGLQAIKGLQSEETMAVQLAASGLVAVHATAIYVLFELLGSGAETFAAMVSAIASCTPAIVAAVTLVVILVLIPIIYLMTKPANCILLLVNELDEELEFVDDYNVSGKRSAFTRKIPKVFTVPSSGIKYYSAGIYTTSKNDNSLFGTQYGFRMRGAKTGKEFLFGMECPLTSIITDNNCYCSFSGTPEDIAKQTEKHNIQSFNLNDGHGYCCSITCHSGAGSVAYYKASIRRNP